MDARTAPASLQEVFAALPDPRDPRGRPPPQPRRRAGVEQEQHAEPAEDAADVGAASSRALASAVAFSSSATAADSSAGVPGDNPHRSGGELSEKAKDLLRGRFGDRVILDE